MSENMNQQPLLEMIGIEKSFPGVQVLKGVNFSVNPGEIHSLMGENGAGKSTLIKILTGLYPLDGGEIRINGQKVEIHSRQDAIDAGISVIYQELSLIPTLSVTENIFLAQEKVKGKIMLDRKAMRRKVAEMIENSHFSVSPDDIVESLSVAQQQTVEIMKALLNDAKLIIMDEPTASLNAAESEILFEKIHNLKAQGKSIIYISHRLEEVYAMSDRLTILRNGEVAAVVEKKDIDPVKVVEFMLGRELKSEVKELHEPIPGGSVLKVDSLSTKDLLDGVSFEAYAGQILGIGGLVGSGRTDTLKCIYGLLNYDGGSITLNGEALPKTSSAAIRYGIGLVPEDRRSEGLVLLSDLTDNIALPNYDLNSKTFVISPKRALEQAQESVKKLLIKPGHTHIPTANLSGGNQQKVVLAKWLQRDLKVLLVDEPTVGIDIGAKAEIYDILRSIAAKGGIVIVASSDTEELLKISDRIVILVNGKVFADLKNENLTENDLILSYSGIKREEAV